MAKYAKVRYLDNRPFTYYFKSRGPTNVNKGDEITVTEDEAKGLMTVKNGLNPCWEYVRVKREEKEEVIDDGGRE